IEPGRPFVRHLDVETGPEETHAEARGSRAELALLELPYQIGRHLPAPPGQPFRQAELGESLEPPNVRGDEHTRRKGATLASPSQLSEVPLVSGRVIDSAV